MVGAADSGVDRRSTLVFRCRRLHAMAFTRCTSGEAIELARRSHGSLRAASLPVHVGVSQDAARRRVSRGALERILYRG